MKRCETARLATTLAMLSGGCSGCGAVCMHIGSYFCVAAWFVISLALWIHANRLIDQVLTDLKPNSDP